VSIEGEQSGGESSAPPPLQSNAWGGGGRDLSAKKLLEEYERQQMLYIPGAFLAGDSVDEVSEKERQKARESRREQERAREKKRETEQDRTSGEGTDSNEEEIGGWGCWSCRKYVDTQYQQLHPPPDTHTGDQDAALMGISQDNARQRQHKHRSTLRVSHRHLER